ncbi:MAG: hypothetical protein C5S41_03125, partial [Candidatus Methanomarinus sp.]
FNKYVEIIARLSAVNVLRLNGNSESGHVTIWHDYGRLHGWSEQGAQSSNRPCLSRTGADGRVGFEVDMEGYWQYGTN